ncbi:MAG: ABC transporter substrate-binding protein [Chloroflexi bacterium]|nr:ABC transporter substrate-binding protein [Chloroflexota bacterium]
MNRAMKQSIPVSRQSAVRAGKLRIFESSTLLIVCLVLAAVLWSLACTAASPAATPPPATKAAAPALKTTVEQRWESTLAEARKEGVVTVYALWRPENRTTLTQAFKDKYGINIEFSPFSRGSDLLAKVQAEQRAGMYVADVFGAGGPTLVATMKPEGVLGSIEPLLMLPEVMDAKYWGGGKFPFLDKDKTAVGMIASVQRYLAYNTDLIKKGEITTYKDVLKPQYKGKLTLNDPTVTGVGNAFLSHLAMDIWNLEETKAYLRALVRDQGAVIQRDNRLHVESVARGKFPIAVAPLPDGLDEFLKLGAPIDAVIVKEGTFVSPAAGAMAVAPKPAHPNATAVFVNWVLTKEGQTVFARGFGNPSIRNDVPTEGFHPVLLAQPGEKIFIDSEDAIIFRGQMLAIAKQVIEEAGK